MKRKYPDLIDCISDIVDELRQSAFTTLPIFSYIYMDKYDNISTNIVQKEFMVFEDYLIGNNIISKK